MKKLKYVLPAAALAFSAFVGLPAYADDPILVGDPDEILGSTVALSTVTATPATFSLAVGERQTATVTYNEGFDVANISSASLTYKSGDYEYTAYAGFDGEYNDETMEYVQDYTSFYVYGNQVGSAVYTISATDNDGNEASTDIAVTVRKALGSDYAAVDGPCEDGFDNECVLYEVGATFGTPVEGATDLSMELVPMTDVLAALDGNLNAVVDLTVKDEDGNVIPVDDNDIEAWFGIRMAELGELANADQLYFQVIYIEDGAIVKYYDTVDVENDGWGWMFTVKGLSHFSRYGILVSDTPFDSAENRNALLPPNTGVYTGTDEGATVNYTGLIVTVSVMTAMLVAYKIVEYRRNNH